jgi:hypothetical protein
MGFNVVVTVTLVSLSNSERNLTPASPIVLKLTPDIWAHLIGISFVFYRLTSIHPHILLVMPSLLFLSIPFCKFRK